MISIISAQVWSKKLDCLSLKKKDLIFKKQKYIFCPKFLCIKIGKTEFSLLITGSENSSKYQRIHTEKSRFHCFCKYYNVTL